LDLSVRADYCGGVADTGSSKKKARRAGATVVIAEMLRNSKCSDLMQLPTSDQNNEYVIFLCRYSAAEL